VGWALLRVGEADKFIAVELEGVVCRKVRYLEPNARPEPCIRGIEKINKAMQQRRVKRNWK
jgi:hypothetical protein